MHSLLLYTTDSYLLVKKDGKQKEGPENPQGVKKEGEGVVQNPL